MSTVVTLEPYVSLIEAQYLRIGKQLLTEDGWQTIKGLSVFTDADQVRVFTDEREDGDADYTTDGWPFHFGDLVQTRLTPTAEQEYQAKRLASIERKRLRRLAMAAAQCPPWCVEHYETADDEAVRRNHNSGPVTVIGADAGTDAPVEFEFWLERRDSRYTGGAETVGVLHTSTIRDDVELTPDAMLLLSARLSSLANRARLDR